MKTSLHILHLEDDANDAMLVQLALEAGGIGVVITRVQIREEFEAALATGVIDVVLSDYSLPGFDGLAALEFVRTHWPNVPFILVTGTMGEERAIDALKSGATDYVLKARLARLVPAVRRAMQEVEAQAERRRLQAQFIEGQKMDVIGQLAAGVAHDFNNILAIIMGCIDMVTLKLGPQSAVRKYTEEIRRASERAAGLTRQLLVFGRKETVQPVVLDLSRVVDETDKMLRWLIHENIEMTILPGKRTGHVLADSGYIGQLLMNLVVNARDAMPKGGRLIIATTNVTLDEAHVRAHPGARVGDHLLLSVADTGDGMTDEVKAHIFEAFFTTKPLGKGTGLGLATCQTIVQQCGGHISVSSQLGQGTTFNVYFPRVPHGQFEAAKPAQNGHLLMGTETLLVVDDEPAVKHLACGVMEAHGYDVLSAANGQEALQVARAHLGAPIRLVISDMVMPLMGGLVMAQWLTATYPDLKFLFTSGYTDVAATSPENLGAGVEFMAKPYTSAALAHKVREMLDAN